MIPFDIGDFVMHLVDGGSATFVRRSNDEFRRIWSGYGLVAEPTTSFLYPLRNYMMLPALMYIGVCCSPLLKILQSRRRSRRGSEASEGGRCIVAEYLLVVLMLGVTSTAVAQKAEAVAPPRGLPEDVATALAQNAQTLTPLTVNYTERLRPLLPAEQTLEAIGLPYPPSEEFFATVKKQLTLQDNKLYATSTAKAWGLREQSFDGDILYIGTPQVSGAAEGSLSQGILDKTLIDRLAKERPHDKWMSLSYLEPAGFWVPRSSIELARREQPMSRILVMLRDGGELISVTRVTIGGTEFWRLEVKAINPERQAAVDTDLVALEKMLRSGKNSEQYIRRELDGVAKLRELPAEQRYTFYLDPKRHYAVTQCEMMSMGGELLERVENDNFQKLEGRDLWLPRRSISKHYTWPSVPGKVFKEPVLATEIQVSSIETGVPPESRFALNYTTPGTLIVDQSSATGELAYPVPASAADLDQALGRARENGLLASAGTGYWWTLVALGIAIIAAAGIALFARRSRAKKSGQ